MRHPAWIVIFIAIALAPAAAAHVAPSVRENNRYLKITPLGDRVRLSYTVYLGEIPGQKERARMDSDGDGTLSDAEAQAYADALGSEVAGALELTVDGRRIPLRWDEVHIGLGTPSLSAGSFAVDLLAWPCLAEPEARSAHSLSLYDRFEIEKPGEAELRVEEGPGIQVTRSAFGPESEATLFELKWYGGPGPAGKVGYHLDFRVDGDEAMFPEGACLAPGAGAGAAAGAPEDGDDEGASRLTGFAALAGAFVALAAGLLYWTRRRNP